MKRDRGGLRLCDFHYSQAFSETGTQTVFNDRIEFHLVQFVTHVNADTVYTLTERDQFNFTVYPDGTAKQVGVIWHLRDASGKLAVEQSGQVIFDPSGSIVKITPRLTRTSPRSYAPLSGVTPPEQAWWSSLGRPLTRPEHCVTLQRTDKSK